MVQQWTVWKELLDQGAFGDNVTDDPTGLRGAIKPDWWNVRWIPFTHDGGGNHQCIDLDPGPSGHLGQVMNFDHEVSATGVLADNFRSFLAAFADDLEAGRSALSEGGECLDSA
jgi:cell wall assembly regulator SMI1